MSFLKDKLGRSAVVVAFSLGAFQTLSMIAAPAATAAGSCSFSGGVFTVAAPSAGDNLYVYQDTNGGIHVATTLGAAAPTTATVAIPSCNGVQGGVATTTTINITGDSGPTTNDQTVIIEMAKWDTVAAAFTTLADWAKINWTVNLGSNGPAGDSLVIRDSFNTAKPLNLTGGANGLDLNTDGDLDMTMAGVELFYVDSMSKGGPATSLANPGNVVNLGGSTITGAALASAAVIGMHPTALNLGFALSVPFSDMVAATCVGAPFPTCAAAGGAATTGDNLLTGGTANDVIRGGVGADTVTPGLGSDNVNCEGVTFGGALGYFFDGGDSISYAGSATAINGNLSINTVTQGVDLDSTLLCENIVATGQADTLIGDGVYNWFQPGDGNDSVNGGTDTLLNGVDYSDTKAGVTVDLIAGTATGGSGSDTLANINDVFGSGSDDIITGNGHANSLWGWNGNDTLSGGAGDGDGADTFDGGSGIDTVDYGNNTLATTVDLASGAAVSGVAAELDTIVAVPPTVENAILGTGDDSFLGSPFNNIVWPNGGQNVLSCFATATPANGCGGIDTVNYSTGYTAGVTINLANGGGTGGASDSITGFANAVGTAFNDSMTGTDVIAGGGTGANLLVGGKGNDLISANAGPDLVRAGAGNDRIRGGAGDDTLEGQGGKDNIRGSGGADDIFGGKGKDFCTGGGGNDFIKTCEKPKDSHGNGPNGPGLHQRI